jgi:hypothetical protein
MKRLLFLGIWGLALLALAVLPGPSPAGGCYPSYYSYPVSYSYPTYYTPTYYQPYPVYVEKEVVKPYAVKSYVSPDYYYSVQDYYRDKLLVDAMAGRSVALLAQLKQLQTQANAVNLGGYTYYGVNQGQQLLNPATTGAGNPYAQQGQGVPGLNPTLPPGSTSPSPGGQQQAQAAQPAGPGVGGVNPKLTEAVQGACIRCHNGKDRDRINLTDLGRLGYYERAAILSEVARGTMPKNGKPWDKEGLALLEEYVDQTKRAGK